MRQNEFVKSQLALAAWREGHSFGGHVCSVMVAQAIANRVRQGWGGWLEVLERIPVFSAVNADEQPKGMPEVWEPGFVRLLQEVDGIHDGTNVDLVKSATFWCDLPHITREWFRKNVLEKSAEHPRVANCQTLYFFR